MESMKWDKIITTDEEYQIALNRLSKIFDTYPDSQEGMEAELLVTLIEKYEKKVEKGIGYQQISGDYYLGEDLNDPQDLTHVLDQIKVRFENNIDEIIRVHKLK